MRTCAETTRPSRKSSSALVPSTSLPLRVPASSARSAAATGTSRVEATSVGLPGARDDSRRASETRSPTKRGLPRTSSAPAESAWATTGPVGCAVRSSTGTSASAERRSRAQKVTPSSPGSFVSLTTSAGDGPCRSTRSASSALRTDVT